MTLLNPDALDAYGTGRASPLLPGYAAIHADLHNHTQLSDGRGDPAKAFASMRDAGLDAAAITDHTNLPGVEGDWEPSSLDEPGCEQLLELAAADDRAGEFVAIRGFEWSHPALGHVNVWDSPRWIAPELPSGRDIHRLYDWLETEEAGEALASFNHPGSRGTVLRFGDFILRAPLLPRMVGLEMFNKTDDYLFAFNHEGVSPLVQCLDAGWRPGLIGVTDEHGANWGQPEGKGRTGLLVNELSRAGIRDALASRRSFASRVKGLRLVATLGGALMGQRLRGPVSAGPVELAVDLELGPMAVGTELSVQLLRWSRDVPVVEEVGRVTSGDGVFRTHVEVDPDEPWIVLRVTDPAGRAGGGTPWRHVELGRSIAYASPWWIAAE
ncbi:MAG: hypothetical protein JWN96_2688 [Mycobacterium sp.]|nr:hypothetical protein [Mycobacterium sp.]